MTTLVHLTTTQVARRFEVDSSTVRRWVAAGIIRPAITTPGGHFKFASEDVEELANRGRPGHSHALASGADRTAAS